jgi:hypothetical protein
MLDSSGTLGLGDAVAQPGPPPGTPPAETPPPYPPPPAYGVGGVPTPVIAIWLATIAAMIYIATRHSSGNFHFTVPNSPA